MGAPRVKSRNCVRLAFDLRSVIFCYRFLCIIRSVLLYVCVCVCVTHCAEMPINSWRTRAMRWPNRAKIESNTKSAIHISGTIDAITKQKVNSRPMVVINALRAGWHFIAGNKRFISFRVHTTKTVYSGFVYVSFIQISHTKSKWWNMSERWKYRNIWMDWK